MKNKAPIVILVLVAIAATFYYLGYFPTDSNTGNNDETSDDTKPLYLALDPPFVVNFTHLGSLRYLQTSLEVMYHDQLYIDRVISRMPAIRNDLILLLSNQDYEQLSTLRGKEQLREEIRTAINSLINVNENSPESGEIYFTNFVMQ